MSVYPFQQDSDNELPRIDDNISELGGDAINALRDAVFNIEEELGIKPAGSKNSVADRLDVSLNANGTIKTSALTSVGLATLPIVDNQVATGAGIKEYKLDLDFSTSDLHTLTVANKLIIDSLDAFTTALDATINSHIGGSSNPSLRHVASHIDLNAVPSDLRDTSYTWSGLKDKDGNDRAATTVAEALDQINTSLITHENIQEVNSPGAHPAAAIFVDSGNFVEISQEVDNVQDALEALDNADTLKIGLHRATMHSAGVPKDVRSQSFINPDGYRDTVVPPTAATTHVAHNPPGTSPVDNTVTGDQVIVFKPTNTNYIFDAQFSQVNVGDHVRINYGNGLEALTTVESIRFIPGSEWVIRTSKTNLVDSDCSVSDGYDAYVRIDRPLFDDNTYGILAVASANPVPAALYSDILGSVIIGHPRGATALGIGFDPNQLDATHYKLYLELYPTGNPAEHAISLPGIDVTGNAGATVGKYTLETVVQETNNSLRNIGYNFRFIAFAHHTGNFGIMLADAINGAAFAIVSGSNATGSLIEGTFSNNVVGNARAENFDALGLGLGRADVASPTYQSSFTDSTAAQLPTKIIYPFKRREYAANGLRRDKFAPTYLATLDVNDDGYWPATIYSRTPVGTTTVEVTYKVDLELQPAELKAGKTIVVQNAVDFSSGLYNDVDYGRFIIKEVTFVPACAGVPGYTLITVINGLHGYGSGFGPSAAAGLNVKLYFSEDSASFNAVNLIDAIGAGANYHRLHEIYVTNLGETFTHERARIPIVSPPPAMALDASKWHVINISPKLRGYRLDSSSALNKYVRLVITDYDAGTGEFTGYIGKPSVSAINVVERPGITVVGRKNVPVRFYDETNVDYIELMFRDDATVPGVDEVLPDATDRGVDIELFPTLALDDELLKLATCEVNWQPGTGIDTIEHVRDCRPHGSISEQEFTQSAKDYIQAGDRYLHSNGVLRGLSYRAQSADDDREFFFDGGVALIDGAIVTANQGSVTIPEVFEAGQALPDYIDWVVCLNKFGDFEPIVLTTSKTQFFAKDNVSGSQYYIPSVTFTELVNTRKDLTPLYIINVKISSFALQTIVDARRYIANETSNIPLTWVPDLAAGGTQLQGHFRTFEALESWINNYGSLNNTVKVRGTFAISSSIDMSGLTNSVTLEGENATFNVTAAKGIILGSDITIRGITFNYDAADPGFTAGNLINDNISSTYYGCILGRADVSTSLSNICIENCEFNHTTSALRAPFVHFSLADSASINNVDISKCSFSDSNIATQTLCAIAIVGTHSGSVTTSAPTASNVLIESNICSHEQGMVVTAIIGANNGAPGLCTSNVSLNKNQCGAICYNVSGISSTAARHSFIIENNTCGLILGPVAPDQTPHYIGNAATVAKQPSGVVRISGNNANAIAAWNSKSTSAARGAGFLVVENNTLQAYSATLAQAWAGSGNLDSSGTLLAMTVLTRAPIVDDTNIGPNNCIITNNYIESGYIGGSEYNYVTGMYINGSATISNNHIGGLGALSGSGINVGIWITGLAISSSKVIVTGNHIFRESTRTINAFILGSGQSSADFGALITDNYFSSPYIDSGSSITTTISGAGQGWVVERNKNQTGTVTLNSSNGSFSVGNVYIISDVELLAGDASAAAYGASAGAAISCSGFSAPGTIILSYDTALSSAALRFFVWQVSLEDVLPKGTYVTQVEMSASADAVAVTTGVVQYYVRKISASATNLVANSSDFDFTGAYTPGTTINSLTAATSNVQTGTGNNITFLMYGSVESSSDCVVTVLSDGATGGSVGTRITYRW
jgi:hypothetical protein